MQIKNKMLMHFYAMNERIPLAFLIGLMLQGTFVNVLGVLDHKEFIGQVSFAIGKANRVAEIDLEHFEVECTFFFFRMLLKIGPWLTVRRQRIHSLSQF